MIKESEAHSKDTHTDLVCPCRSQRVKERQEQRDSLPLLESQHGPNIPDLRLGLRSLSRDARLPGFPLSRFALLPFSLQLLLQLLLLSRSRSSLRLLLQLLALLRVSPQPRQISLLLSHHPFKLALEDRVVVAHMSSFGFGIGNL
mgnify:CR=1 FL=1